MLKIIEPGAQDFGVPMASLVEVHSRGVERTWMTKRAAAAGVFEGLELRPNPGHSIVHLIAMGDAEHYGMNRNGDIFFKQGQMLDIPEPFDGMTKQVQIHCGNIDRHQTFEKFAKVYRNHKNKDPKKSHGDVVKSAHNNAMARVELLVDLPDDNWGPELHKLASGEPVEFSMACRVPYDVCTYCGHKAGKKEQYCEHAKNHMTQILKSGHQVGVANDFMTYFDISKVFVNADRIAFGLMKAAGVTLVVPAAYLADDYMLFPPENESGVPDLSEETSVKLAELKKLCDIEKDVQALGSSPQDAAALPSDIPDDIMQELQALMPQDKSNLLGALADVKISLSLRDLMKLLLSKQYGSVEPEMDEAERLLPGLFGRALESNPEQFVADSGVNMGNGLLPGRIRSLISGLVPSHSLDMDPARQRVTMMIIRGGQPSMEPLEKPAGLSSVAGGSKVARGLAEAYGRYKLAFLRRNGGTENRPLTALALLQHYWS